MKNYRTPRTLDESIFTTGYPVVPRPERKRTGWLVVAVHLAGVVFIAYCFAQAVPA